MASIKKEVGKYKLDKVGMKLTGKAVEKTVEKNKVWTIGATTLTGDLTSKVAELKGKVIVVTGALTEDDKGKQSLALASVDEVTKKK
jgi:hypothetical protein